MGFVDDWTRRRGPVPAIGLVHEDIAPAVEKNGFTLLDVSPAEVKIRLFAWKSSEPVERIDTLEPYHSYSIRRA